MTSSRSLEEFLHSPLNAEGLSEQKKEQIASHFTAILQILGLDLENPSLKKTPHRIAKMYVDELFAGLDPNNYPEITAFDLEEQPDQEEMILIQNISVRSTCEHHFVPMTGIVSIAYLPKGKVLGLSKVLRIVDFLSRQPQLQEKLTNQIAEHLSQWTGSDDIAVYMKLKHYCIALRGVKDQSSETQTSVMRGAFLTQPLLRQDFYSRIQV